MAAHRSAVLAVLAAFVVVLSVGVVARAAPAVPDPGQSVRCEPGTVTTPTNTVRCDITQTSTTGGNNNAECDISSNAPNIVLICNITQSTNGGDNHAKVRLRAHQNKSPTEKVNERATVKQTTTGSGSNFLDLDEDAKQQIEPPEGNTQNQTARQFATANQKSDTGQNLIKLNQSQNQHAESNKVATQHQTSSAQGHISQDSAGISRTFADQDADQHLVAKPGSTQIQDPDEFCCSHQASNPADTIVVNQKVRQRANGTSQRDNIFCDTTGTTGTGTCRQSVTTNQGTTTNSCGPKAGGCAVFIVCGGETGPGCTPGTGGFEGIFARATGGGPGMIRAPLIA